LFFDAALLGLAAFVVFAVTAQYQGPLNNDTDAASVASWQLAIHGNANLTGLTHQASWLFHVGGREVTNRLPGVMFWAVPFYVALGTRNSPNIYPGALAAATASAIAVALVFRLVEPLVGRRSAVVAALLFGFGTGTWAVSADQLWTHGPAQLAVLSTLMLARRDRWLLAGIPAGFAILVRPHLGIVAAVLGIVEAVRTRRWQPLLISAGALVGIAILLIYNHDVWGHYTIFGGYAYLESAPGHSIGAFVLNVAGALVSPERGMLVMTPALLLLLPGLRRAWKIAPWWVRSGALAGLAYLLAQLWIIRFSGGSGFYSYRVTLEGLSLASPLLVLAWREWTARTRFRRTAFAALAAASVALQAFGAIIPWVPSGQQQPWSTFLPIDLARHIGVGPTVASAVLAFVLIAGAGRLTWTRGKPVSGQPGL
jgi:hypothetical protein